MINTLFEFLSSIIRKGADVLASGLVGLALGYSISCLTFPKIARWLGFQPRGTERDRETIAELTGELEKMKESNQGLNLERMKLIAQNRLLKGECEGSKGEATTLRNEVDSLGRQMEVILKTDGKIWEAPAREDRPAFVQMWHRRATIIAVVNLKGGVGKTTISANLGATLALMRREVLLIDLDHQHSLSDLCFTKNEHEDLKKQARLIDPLFASSDTFTPQRFQQLINRVGHRQLSCIASDEPLSDQETRAMARWLVQAETPDVRYLLRSCLHDQSISSQFDWIILDCPPRLTTCSINALAAADYVLIPTILDAPSLGAVPRMIQWLRRLKCESKICPDLSLLGVVANMTSQSTGLTEAEQQELVNLEAGKAAAWVEPVHYFRHFIPRKVAFSHVSRAHRDNRFAAEDNALNSIFRDLTTELLARVPNHHGHRHADPISANA